MILLGLGTNLGDRLENLSKAVNSLKEIVSDIKCSSIYESVALLPPDAPEEWNKKFLNMALSCESDLNAHELLKHLKSIEHEMGRTNKYERWSPRVIDIDILAYDNVIISDQELTIPHVELLSRDFVIIPINEISPEWAYPKHGPNQDMKISEIIKNMNDQGLNLKKTDYKLK